MLKIISVDTEVKLRLNGSKYYDEFVLSENQKLAIYFVLKQYFADGGNL